MDATATNVRYRTDRRRKWADAARIKLGYGHFLTGPHKMTAANDALSSSAPKAPRVSAIERGRSAGADERVLSVFYSFLDLPHLFARQLMRAGIELHSNLVGKIAYRTLPPYFQDSRPARPFHTLRKGDSASSETEIRPELLLYFARASGDWNVLHFSETHAANTRFKHPIAHGMLVSSFVSALLSCDLPGPGTLYESQSLSFKAPVFIGDTITARVTVVDLDAGKRQVTLAAEARNQDGVMVLCGNSVVRLMRPKADSG